MPKILQFPVQEKALQQALTGKTLDDVYQQFGAHIWAMEQSIGTSAHYSLYNRAAFDPDQKELLDTIERFAVYNQSIRTEKGDNWLVDKAYVARLYDALRALDDFNNLDKTA